MGNIETNDGSACGSQEEPAPNPCLETGSDCEDNEMYETMCMSGSIGISSLCRSNIESVLYVLLRWAQKISQLG